MANLRFIYIVVWLFYVGKLLCLEITRDFSTIKNNETFMSPKIIILK